MGARSSAPGSIPGMECLRSITSLVHRVFPNARPWVAFGPNRIREVCAPCVLLRGQSRSSTAKEHSEKFGRRGFDSHRARQFRRAVEFGLSVKRETASAFKPRTIGQPMDSQLALCPSFLFWMGRCASVIKLGSSTALEQLAKSEKMRVRLPSRNIEVVSCPSFTISTGRRIGLSFITTWSPVRVRPPEPNAGVAQW